MARRSNYAYTGQTPYTLTSSYADCGNAALDATKRLEVRSEQVAAIFVEYTTGAGETNNYLSWYVEFSPDDGTTWVPQKIESVTSGGSVSTDNVKTLQGPAAATVYYDSVVVPLTAKNMRIKVKETGVVTNAGTVKINVVLGDGGAEAYNRSAQVLAVSSAVLSTVAESASNVVLVAANPNRRGLVIVNDASSILYVAFAATATTAAFTVKIAAGGYWEHPQGVMYTGIVSGIWAAATGGAARITEL